VTRDQRKNWLLSDRRFTVRRMGLLLVVLTSAVVQAGAVQVDRDEAQRQLTFRVGDQKLTEYHYSPDHFLTYFHPILSPSGKELTVRETQPYPHHRSLWFADRVQLEGQPIVGFYDACYKNQHRIRHDKFVELKADEKGAVLREELLWEMDKKTPVLKERRDVRLVPLENGEYFLDIRFTVTAEYGDVHFHSDAAHYAWPYVRMHPQFSVDKGGKLVNSEGGVNQKGTCDKVATWTDYSNTVDGKTEGLAFFSHSENDHPHRWLTRDYGTFGPRRADAQSGKPFTLKRGESLKRRIGLLVHNGDAKDGKVAERYEQYVGGKLSPLE
jgi:hypothetical protein